MGHSLPVFFFPVDASASLLAGTPWYDAEALIGDALDAGSLWQDTSRNWWHGYITLRVAESLQIEDLGFLKEEAITVPNEALERVHSAIEALFRHLQSGQRIPELVGDYDYELISHPEHVPEIGSAEPSRDNNDEDRSGPEGARYFYSFLRSLQAAISEAKQSGRNFAFVQPQP